LSHERIWGERTWSAGLSVEKTECEANGSERMLISIDMIKRKKKKEAFAVTNGPYPRAREKRKKKFRGRGVGI